MSKNFFYPLIVHILLSAICHLIFRLTWMGPEGGAILEHFPDINIKIVFILSIVVQVIVILIYFCIGKKTCSLSRYTLFAIGSICLLNVISIMIIYCFCKDVGVAMELFSIFGGSTFFVFKLLGYSNIITNIIAVIAPSVIMFAGCLFEKYYVKIRSSSENE